MSQLKINEKTIIEFETTVRNMLQNGFKFTITHNPTESRLTIISSTKPDKIKNKFPEFNIYLSNNGSMQKIVDKSFFYDE